MLIYALNLIFELSMQSSISDIEHVVHYLG
jgi:hypothetical protein